MFSKKLAALVAASLVVATTPAVAQVAPVPADVRASAVTTGESELAGGGFWAAVLGIALLAAFVLVIIEDDDVDLPTSP